MNFSLIDACGLALAAASYGVVLILPGAALAALFDIIGFRSAAPGLKPFIAVLTGLALLPGIDSLIARFAGLDAALIVNLALAVSAFGLARRQRWTMTVSRVAVGVLAIWFTVYAFEWIDFDIGGKLYQPFVVIDLVKHAATTQALLDTGAPSRDPFFFRLEKVSYYYFFYTLAALAERLWCGLIDARAAVGGLAFWTAIGLYGTARLAIQRAGLLPPGDEKRVRIVLLLLLAASGLDIIAVLRLGLLQHMWLPDSTAWTDDVAGWLEALLWVPHHLTAAMASLLGFMVLADGVTKPPREAARAILAAGLCFVSSLGLSVWLTLAAVATVALWLITLVVERRWRAVAIVLLAGLAALVIATPAILDLMAGRAGAPPVSFAIRAFSPVDAVFKSEPLASIMRFVALPLNYFAEFGVLFLGALSFWQGHSRRDVHRNEFARLLTLCAIAGLALGTFLRSDFFQNNDLGWRVLMFPQIAGLVWTTALLLERWDALPVARGMPLRRVLTPALMIVLCLGYATTLYTMVSLRAYDVMPLKDEMRLFATHPESDRAKRTAYLWANAHLPVTLVLQHSPILGKRAVNFGLYSRNPVGVSDCYGALYGARPAAVEQRLRDVIPIFTDDLKDADARARAQANGIDALVVTADDPVWALPTSWLWRTTPLYQSDFVRIVPVSAIGTTQIGSLK